MTCRGLLDGMLRGIPGPLAGGGRAGTAGGGRCVGVEVRTGDGLAGEMDVMSRLDKDRT